MIKKGFTLVELLVVLVIIALLGGIGIISFTALFGTSEERYYNTLESNILLAGNDYFSDHRESLPTGDHVNEVQIEELVSEKYLEPLKKTNGETCNEGKVYVYRENDKYKYEACILCDEKYTSDGKYCSGEKEKEIIISAKKKQSGNSYNALLSYDQAEYSKENVEVTISLKNENMNVSRYQIINTKNGVELSCHQKDNTCSMEIGTSGTYEIKAKDGEKVLATKYISVKVQKNGPNFTVTRETELTPLTCLNGDNTKELVFKITKDNINEEYRSVKYEIYQREYNETTNEQILTLVKSGTENNLIKGTTGKEYYIKENLGSGSYELVVTITNFAGESTTNSPALYFDVSYFANIVYNGGNNSTGTHEVIYGQIYDYVETLPVRQNGLYIKWLRNNENGIINLENRWDQGTDRMSGTTKVTNSCSHTIVGLVRTPVDIVQTSVGCKDTTPIYNGSKQLVTKSAPTNVTFSNNEYTNAGSHPVTAHIDNTKYIWSNDTFADKTFNCSISQRAVTVRASDQSKTYDGSALVADSTCTISGEVSGHTVTCSNNTGSQKNYGSSDKGVGNVVIKDGSNSDVTANYSISKENGTLSVSKKPITVSVSADNKVYDGTTSAKCKNATLSGVVSGDSVSASVNSSGTFNNKNVGTGKTVTCTGISLSGTSKNNYSVDSTKTTTANITAKALVANTPSCSNKTYNGNNSASCTITYNNVESGDSVSGGATCTFADKNVGNNKTVTCSSFTKSGTGNGNYTVPSGSKTTTANITAKALVANTPSCSNKTYNGNNSASCTITYNNVESGDSVSGGATCTFDNANAGNNKTVTCSSFTKSGTGNGNYTVPTGNKTTTANITAQACNAPTNVSISSAGVVTWTASSNCSSATHQISIDGANFTNATSGVNYNSTIVASTGTRTVYVRAAAPNSNYSTSSAASKSVSVYSVSLTKGTGISSVSGGGNYISGATVTLGASVSTGYSWSGWSGTPSTSTQNYSATISGNWSTTATATINYYYLDLNGWLDGSSNGGISGYGTCDVYINGSMVANDVADYYTQHPYGTTYEFKDCKATTGHTYNGVHSGNISGTIGAGAVSVFLDFTINKYWNDVNIYSPGGSQDFQSGYVKLSRDGVNWTGELTNEDSTTNNVPYGGKIYVKYVRPYYDYYELDHVTGADYDSATDSYVHTVTAASQVIGVYMRYKSYSFNINMNLPDGTEPYSTCSAGIFSVSYDGGSNWSNNVCNEGISTAKYGQVILIKNISPATYMNLSSVTGASWDGTNYKTTITGATTININTAYNTYTITYDANGGSGAPSATTYTYAPSGTTNLSSTTPSKTGYTFLGWSLSSTATSASYSAGQAWNLSNGSNYTLYAVWTVSTYTITYDANGGSGAPSPTTYTYAATGTTNLSSTTPTRSGYTFLGWSLSSTATSASYSAGQAWKLSNDNDYYLYAVWDAVTYNWKAVCACLGGTGAAATNSYYIYGGGGFASSWAAKTTCENNGANNCSNTCKKKGMSFKSFSTCTGYAET